MRTMRMKMRMTMMKKTMITERIPHTKTQFSGTMQDQCQAWIPELVESAWKCAGFHISEPIKTKMLKWKLIKPKSVMIMV